MPFGLRRLIWHEPGKSNITLRMMKRGFVVGPFLWLLVGFVFIFKEIHSKHSEHQLPRVTVTLGFGSFCLVGFWGVVLGVLGCCFFFFDAR